MYEDYKLTNYCGSVSELSKYCGSDTCLCKLRTAIVYIFAFCCLESSAVSYSPVYCTNCLGLANVISFGPTFISPVAELTLLLGRLE